MTLRVIEDEYEDDEEEDEEQKKLVAQNQFSDEINTFLRQWFHRHQDAQCIVDVLESMLAP